jgi:hypothetical protein
MSEILVQVVCPHCEDTNVKKMAKKPMVLKISIVIGAKNNFNLPTNTKEQIPVLNGRFAV